MPCKPNITKLPMSSIVMVKDKPAGEVARAMIENGHQNEPFYIFDFDTAYESVQTFREKLPRVQIFYAMKSNDYSMMVKLAISLGLGFDCASPGEINKVLKYNVRPRNIIYAAPMKTPEQMKFARKSGVRHTTFDSFCELKRLREYWPDSRLLIRVKLESDSVYKLGDKFGCDYDEAVSLLDEAARLGMIVIGVAFHVGSGCFSKKSYTEGLRIAKALFDHENRAGRKMTLLDIGGGFLNDETNNFEQAANLINKGLAKWFPDPDVQIIAEPGRYICESAFTLYSNIRDIRTFQLFNCNETANMVYLNNGTNGTLRFVEKWHIMNKFKRTTDIGRTKDFARDTVICGPTLDDRDFLEPAKLASCSLNDWLIFNHQGAYCAVFKSEFCCMENTLTRSVISHDLWATLKDKPVFSSSVFVMDSAIPPVLPSTLPPVHLNDGKYTMSDKDYVVDFKSLVTPAYVLESQTPDEVARTMIEGGQQVQPFYIFNMDESYRRVQHFKEMMPRVKIFYAMKSNDYSMIVKLAIALGLGFDCASPGEIKKVLKYNVRPRNIIYAAPMKTPEQIKFARKFGVRHTTFDSFCELKRLREYWPDSRLLIRVKLESDSVYKLGDKFGCDYDEALSLLDEAARLGIIVIGVAFHVGSGCFSKKSYTEGLRIAKDLFDHENRAGRKMTLLDIGGGFLHDGTNNFEQAANLINKGLAKWFPDPDVQIIAEPGRYICESAFTLYSNIRDVRTFQLFNSNETANMVYLNNGTNGTLRFVEKWHIMNKFKRTTDIGRTKDLARDTVICGPTLDDRDFLGPAKLAASSLNDWLIFCHQGAYCAVFKSEFCCMENTLTRSVISHDLWAFLKDKPVFSSSVFVMDSAIPSVLPSTLPPVHLNDGKYNASTDEQSTRIICRDPFAWLDHRLLRGRCCLTSGGSGRSVRTFPGRSL